MVYRNCDRCGAKYPERKQADDVTFFLCDTCKKKYEAICDYYAAQKQHLIKEESQALWDFLNARVE